MKLAFVIGVATVSIATACGGSTDDSSANNAGSGGTGKGGAASGGKSGSGGINTGGSGGTNTGGAATGGSGGTTNTGGAAGTAGVGHVGDACQSDSQCPSSAFAGGTCDTDAPGGYCTVIIAECPAGSGQGACPDGSSCVNGVQFAGKFGDFCLANCANQNDCRTGYVCCPWQGTTGVCKTGATCA